MIRADSRRTVVAFFVILLATGAGLRALTWKDASLDGVAHRDLGRPVLAQAGAVAALRAAVRPWATACAPRPAPPSAGFKARLDAIGRLVCKVSSTAITSLTAYQFASRPPLDADVADIVAYFPYSAGPCTDSAGITVWSDRQGHREGRIVCATDNDGTNYVYWTDDAHLRLFVVAGPDRTAVEAWWEATVRPEGAYPTPAEHALLGLMASQIDVATCRRTTPGAPMAIADVNCDGGKTTAGSALPADYVEFALFGSTADLEARIAGDAADFAPNASYDPHREYLTTTSQGATDYSFWATNPGDRRRGELLHFDYSGIDWLSWTLDSRKLYGRVGLSDQNAQETFRAFGTLGLVGLPSSTGGA
jgi:hypothetical protein